MPVKQRPDVRQLEGLTLGQIAKQFGVARSTAQGWVAQGKRAKAVEEVEEGPLPSTLFDERWATFNKWIGRSGKASKARVIGDSSVILHIADMHIPYMDEGCFAAAVTANKDAGTLVIGGDALNCGAASRFIEGSFDDPRTEMAQLSQVLLYASENFEEVHCNIGNHVDRIRKFFGARIPPYMMFLVETNPIQFVVEGLRKERGVNNIHIAKSVIDNHDGANWLTLLGSTAFTHAEKHGKASVKPAEESCRWLRRWQRHLPVWPDAIAQEHNHRGAKYYDEELGALLIQTPCCSTNHSYQMDATLKYGPNQLGWTRIVQKADGTINVNESNYFLYEP